MKPTIAVGFLCKNCFIVTQIQSNSMCSIGIVFKNDHHDVSTYVILAVWAFLSCAGVLISSLISQS